LELLEWNYCDQGVPEEASLREDFDDHLREMASSLATYCPKLAQVKFFSMEEYCINSLNIEREGGCEIIAASCSDCVDLICTSAWKSSKYSDL